jgi:hypothetical protein
MRKLKKDSSNCKNKNRVKIPPKSRKLKIFQHIERGDSIQTHRCINANQEFTKCGNHLNILPLFGGLKGSLTFSSLLTYTTKHTHTSQRNKYG